MGGGVIVRAYTNGTDKNVDRIRGNWFSEFNNNITRKSINQSGNGPGITGREMMDTIKERFAGTWIGDSRVEYENRITEESSSTCNEYNDYYSLPNNIKETIHKQFSDKKIAWDIWVRTDWEKYRGIESVRHYDKDHLDTTSHLENIRVCIKETYRITPTERTLINSEITKLIYILNSTSYDIRWSNDNGDKTKITYHIYEVDAINGTSRTIKYEIDRY